MKELQDRFTETEWMCITFSPICACYAIVFSDMRNETDKEFEVLFTSVEKYKREYSKNTLVQSALRTFDGTEAFKKNLDRMQKFPEEIETNKEIIALAQLNSKIIQFVKDAKARSVGGSVEETMNACVIIIGCANYILKGKNIPERIEFNRMLMGIATDVASAVKEGGMLGFGKSISEKEEYILECLNKILE
jgi:sugar-specific transcriptional regulator TrmB